MKRTYKEKQGGHKEIYLAVSIHKNGCILSGRMLFLINKTCGNIAQHLKYFVSRKADDNHKHRLDTRKKISVRQGTFKK